MSKFSDHVASEFRRFERILMRNLEIAQQHTADAFADEYRTRIVAADAVASREFLNSIRTRVTMSADGKRVVEAYSDVIQAAIMEHGRRAGARMPPVDAILEWMPYRGIEPKRSIAFAIAMKIARDGIPPRYIAEKTFRSQIPRALGDVNLAVAKSVAEFQAQAI
jgi:hypothetical protein